VTAFPGEFQQVSPYIFFSFTYLRFTGAEPVNWASLPLGANLNPSVEFNLELPEIVEAIRSSSPVEELDLTPSQPQPLTK
jgi:hypothetical protein